MRSPTVIDGFDDIVRSDKHFFPKVECNGGKMLNCLLGWSVLLQLMTAVRDLDRREDHLVPLNLRITSAGARL